MENNNCKKFVNELASKFINEKKEILINLNEILNIKDRIELNKDL